MTTYGLTDDGLVIPSMDVIREAINARMRTAFGNTSIDLSDGSVEGQIIAILAERESVAWEAIQAVHSSQDPDKATGIGLDTICLYTGTFREEATASVVSLTLTGTPGTVVSAGSRASTLSTGKIFGTLLGGVDGTIVALTAWAPATLYAVGDQRTNNGNAYVCITTGTSAGSGGPTTTDADITDNTVHWMYMGEGTGAVAVTAACIETGPIMAVAGDITEIETQTSGWLGVINLLDATLGSDRTSEEGLRLLREFEIGALGSTPLAAIRGELSRVEGVTAVTVFQNITDVTDADGVPPHSVEALVTGGEDDEICEALFNAVAAGVRTYGGESGTVTDEEGTDHTIMFSRPEEVDIYVTITLTKVAATYPSDGDAQVKAAIVAFGDAQSTGTDAVATALGAQAFKVAGVFNVPRSGSLGGTLISLTASPTTDATLAITSRQKAVYDTSRITVNSSSVTP
jgi:uncharacterized phage protein gp47/JayE